MTETIGIYIALSIVAFILLHVIEIELDGSKYKLDYTIQQKIFLALGWLPFGLWWIYLKVIKWI